MNANIAKARVEKLNYTKQTAESLGIGVTHDATEKFIDFVAKQPEFFGSGLIGRDGALNIMANKKRAFEYDPFIQKFADSLANETLQGVNEGTVLNKEKLTNQSDFEKRENKLDTKFNDATTNEKKPTYGIFNVEQAKNHLEIEKDPENASKTSIYNPDKTKASTSGVFNDLTDNLINNNKTMQDNNLGINQNLNDKSTQEQYQTYTPVGSDNPVNIVSQVRKSAEIN